MGNINRFEDLLVWQKSISLGVDIYKLFSKVSDYDFKNQIQRAVVSISNNIAEGFERRSNQEFKYFLYISKGSCGEVRSMLYLAYELGYIGEDVLCKYTKLTEEISKMLHGFIKTL